MSAISTKLVCFTICFCTTFLFSQDPSILSVDRIYNSDEFRLNSFGPIRWLEDGNYYTTIEKTESSKSGFDIVQYETKNANRSILVSADQLIPANGKAPLLPSSYQWSVDKKYLMIYTNTKKVWRYHTRGDYWVLNISTGELKQVGKDHNPATLMFAKFSPDSRNVAYVSKNNIYYEDLITNKEIQLTFDGCDSIVNGTSDWVYEEEFSLRDGYRWSPDGKHIAYWQFNTSGTGTFYMINNTDSIYSKPIPLPYPKVGTQNSACKVGFINLESAKTTWFKVVGNPRMNYIPKMEWAASSEEVVIQQMNRLQNTNNVLLGSVKNGAVRQILKEKDDAWIDLNDDLIWLKKGNYFTWISDRDGWRHLYLVSRDGKSIELRSPGKFDIIKVLKIDEKSGWVYFIASPNNPAEEYLFRLSLFGKTKIEQITPESFKGTHSYDISPNLKWAIHTYSNFTYPDKIDLIEIDDHRSTRILEDNKKLKMTFDKLNRGEVEFFKIQTDENIEMDAWMIKPPNFNPDKKYPLFIYVYGEPANQTVLNSWSLRRRLWFFLLAQKGYIIVSIDNRGTPGPKGRSWRKSVYRKIGIIAPQDQAAATRKLLETRTYLDKERVGIWGWSGGGQMTLNAMFKYPNLYKTGMAISFVSDQRLYDTIYQERFMGLPKDNEAGYRLGSPVNFAANLKGNLLIVHGTGDDNVHYQSFEYLVNELVKHNKKFTMMTYPNRSHSINEGKNTQRHLFSLLTNFLENNLQAGAK